MTQADTTTRFEALRQWAAAQHELSPLRSS